MESIGVQLILRNVENNAKLILSNTDINDNQICQ
jgi:hypothetical protein